MTKIKPIVLWYTHIAVLCRRVGAIVYRNVVFSSVGADEDGDSAVALQRIAAAVLDIYCVNGGLCAQADCGYAGTSLHIEFTRRPSP